MQENGKSKTTLCIRMLQILNSGRIYKVSELANLLETNPRNIIEYKRELEDAGYFIVSIPGKFGGYQLDKSSIIPSLKLTEEEKKILQVASDYLNARGDFLDSSIYQKAMSKIFSSMNTLPLVDETFIIPGFTLVMSNEELHSRYTAIETCISNKKKISIDFLSTDNVVRTRVIHPYKLFMFNNAWFVIGYCELANDIRYFKLNRIESFTELNQKFRVLLSYTCISHPIKEWIHLVFFVDSVLIILKKCLNMFKIELQPFFSKTKIVIPINCRSLIFISCYFHTF